MKLFIRLIGWILAAPVMVLMVLSTLDHVDAFSSNNVLYGLDYLPAVWLGAFAIAPITLFLFLGKKEACVYIIDCVLHLHGSVR